MSQRFVILSAALICSAVHAQAVQPRIFFSDLESGPKAGGENNGGAYVTLYGKGFGAAASKVSIGGGAAAAYPIWTDSKITFQLGPAAATGDIVVTTPGGASNPVPFTVRAGTIYFVATNGKDSGSGSFSSPWRTLIKSRDSMKPGDITYARDGVSQVTDDGQGWNTCMLLRSGGSPGKPMAIVAYPGASVTIGNVNGPSSGIRSMAGGDWVFAGLTLRGMNEAATTYGGANWRFVGNDMSCPNGDYATACYETGLSTYIKFYGNNVHDTGKATASALYHGVYFSTDSNHIDMGWNTVANVHGCRGVQIHSSPLNGGGPNDPTGHNQFDISIHDNVIHDTQCDGIILATIDPSKGKVEMYNNIIYNAGKGPNNPEGSGNWSCINAQTYTNTGPTGSGTVEIYNNTFYNCGTFAKPPYEGGNNAVSYSGPNGNIKAHLVNNIFYAPVGIPYLSVYRPGGSACSNSENCPWAYGSNNLFYGSGAAPGNPNLTGSLYKDPLFVNRAQNDFHLQSGSPARGAGTKTSLTVDKEGLRRGSPPDIGALQFGNPSVSSLACNPTAIFTPANTNCTVNLDSEAPADGLQVALASDDPALALPGPLTIAAGSSQASFSLSIPAVNSRIPAQITAGVNEAEATSVIWLLPAGDTAPLVLSIVNAASFLQDGLSPGGLISAFGINLGPQVPVVAPLAGGTVDSTLGGVRAFIGNAPAPVLYAQANQVTVAVPYGVTSGNQAPFGLEVSGQPSNAPALPVTSTTPAIFTRDSSGTGQATAFNETGEANSISNGAAKGSVLVFYAAGLGSTDPAGVDGQIAGGLLPKPLAPLSVDIAGSDSPVLSAASAPGFIAGVFQINVRVPDNIPPGDATALTITAGNASSQPGVTVAIR